eukprot:236171-Hanusia_phi.AAC.2
MAATRSRWSGLLAYSSKSGPGQVKFGPTKCSDSNSVSHWQQRQKNRKSLTAILNLNSANAAALPLARGIPLPGTHCSAMQKTAGLAAEAQAASGGGDSGT